MKRVILSNSPDWRIDDLHNIRSPNQGGPRGNRHKHRSPIVDATKNRLRPILLTSVTTVAGLLPMAYGIGGSDPFSAPMALAMGYGILFATPLTLILLSCLLLVLGDINSVTSAVTGSISRRLSEK